MHFFPGITATLSLLALVSAQNSTSSTSGNAITASSDYGLDPSSVDIGTRQYWCNQQTAQCPLICGDINNNDPSTIQNTCVPESLTYQCVCSNNQSPNATQYTQTIPYFECTTAADDCVNNCPQGDSNCQSNCRTSRQCGATDPKHPNQTTTAATTSAMPSATGSTGGLLNGSGTGAATTFGPNVDVLALSGVFILGLAVLL